MINAFILYIDKTSKINDHLFYWLSFFIIKQRKAIYIVKKLSK
jgi:hypothetical protein